MWRWRHINHVITITSLIAAKQTTINEVYVFFQLNITIYNKCMKLTYTQTIKLCPLDVYVCKFQMYERISFNFFPYKLWSFRNDLHLIVIHLIISVAADKAANTSTLKFKSHKINSLCVRHNPEPFKHILTSLSKLSSKISWLVVRIAFTATPISL